jgi:hypothetical protein
LFDEQNLAELTIILALRAMPVSILAMATLWWPER